MTVTTAVHADSLQQSRHRIHIGQMLVSDGEGKVVHPDGYWFRVEADDVTWGNPQPVEVAMRSLISNGELVRRTHDGNREVRFRVTVGGPDGAVLGLGEQRLVSELGRRSTLAWTPPEVEGPTTVFEVVTSNEEHTFDDTDEMRNQRIYGLRFLCEPYSRPLDEVVTEGVVVGGEDAEPEIVDVLIDDCTSETGWELKPPGSVVLGYLRIPGDNAQAYRAGTVDFTDTEYLSVDWRRVNMRTTSPPEVRYQVDGVWSLAPLVAMSPAPDKPGNQRSVYRMPQVAVDQLWIWFQPDYVEIVTPTTHVQLAELRRTNQPLYSGTTRQKTQTVTVGGSAPTPGRLHVSHPTDRLGGVLVYSSPDASAVPLRDYRTGGGLVTPDTSLVSGAYDSLNSPLEYTISLADLVPGQHAILARVAATAAVNQQIGWDAAVHMGSKVLTPAAAGSYLALFSSGFATYRFVPLGLATLPPVAVPAESTEGELVLTLTDESSDGTAVRIDDVWLFNLSRGTLSWVELGEDTGDAAALNLWIDSPTTDDPVPRYYQGHADDRSDAFHVTGLRSWGTHVLEPGLNNIFTVTTFAEDAVVRFGHYPRYRTHVAAGRRLKPGEVP